MNEVISIEDLANAINHADQFNGQVSVENIRHVLNVAVLKLGLLCFVEQQNGVEVRLDLENGYHLVTKVEEVRA